MSNEKESLTNGATQSEEAPDEIEGLEKNAGAAQYERDKSTFPPKGVTVLAVTGDNLFTCRIDVAVVQYEQDEMRRRMESDDVKILAQSREATGQINISGFRWHNGELTELAGRTRFASDLLNGHEVVLGNVWAGISDEQALAIELAENNRRKHFDKSRLAREIVKEEKLLKSLGLRKRGRPRKENVSSGHGIPPPAPMTPAERKQAERARTIADGLIASGQEALTKKKITQEQALEVGKLDQDQQPGALAQAIEYRAKRKAEQEEKRKERADQKANGVKAETSAASLTPSENEPNDLERDLDRIPDMDDVTKDLEHLEDLLADKPVCDPAKDPLVILANNMEAFIAGSGNFPADYRQLSADALAAVIRIHDAALNILNALADGVEAVRNTDHVAPAKAAENQTTDSKPQKPAPVIPCQRHD